MDTKKTFPLRLAELRKEKGLTQGELADKIGISRQSVTLYERETRIPDIEVLAKLAEFFGVTSDYLIGLEDYRAHELVSVGQYTGLDDGALCALAQYVVSEQEYILSAISEVCKNKRLIYHLARYFYGVKTFEDAGADKESDLRLSTMTLTKLSKALFAGMPPFAGSEIFGAFDSGELVIDILALDLVEKELKTIRKKILEQEATNAGEE